MALAFALIVSVLFGPGEALADSADDLMMVYSLRLDALDAARICNRTCPDSSAPLDKAVNAFENRWGAAFKNIAALVKDEDRARWANMTRQLRDSMEKEILGADDPCKVCGKWTATALRLASGERVPPDILAALLRHDPTILATPQREVAEGFVDHVSTAGLPDAHGLDIRLIRPLSWRERNNPVGLLKQFVGFGSGTIVPQFMVYAQPLSEAYARQAEILGPVAMLKAHFNQQSLNDALGPISDYTQSMATVAGQPALRVEFTMLKNYPSTGRVHTGTRMEYLIHRDRQGQIRRFVDNLLRRSEAGARAARPPRLPLFQAMRSWLVQLQYFVNNLEDKSEAGARKAMQRYSPLFEALSAAVTISADPASTAPGGPESAEDAMEPNGPGNDKRTP